MRRLDCADVQSSNDVGAIISSATAGVPLFISPRYGLNMLAMASFSLHPMANRIHPQLLPTHCHVGESSGIVPSSTPFVVILAAHPLDIAIGLVPS